jgi:uncharacterized protein with HEPN domain
MTSPDPQVYLFHIRACCEELIQCRDLRHLSTVPASILFNAVCRNLEIIGEASKKIRREFRAANPQVPWREMSALRNVLIHNYEGADPELVWAIVERDIPRLLEAVGRLLGGADRLNAEHLEADR